MKRILERFRREVAVYRLVLRDARTPRVSRVLLGAALVYAVTPVDLVPDWIPLVGCMDDLVIIPLLVLAARSCIPSQVVSECRLQADIEAQRKGLA